MKDDRKKAIMKKILLTLLALSIGNVVYAKPIYSEYEFTGYCYDKRDDDELNKYVHVKMNKFYKNVIKDFEYLEADDTNKFEFKDEDDYKTLTKRSNIPVEGEKNIKAVAIKGKDNYLTRKIILSNIDNQENFKIKEIKVTYNGQNVISKIDDHKELYDNDLNTYMILSSDSLEIDLKSTYYVDTISFEIIYDTEKDIKLNYFPKNSSGLLPTKTDINLKKEDTSLKVKTLKKDFYDIFINDNGLSKEDVSYHYEYEKKLHKYYNLEKEYYQTLEATSLDGYTYDPLESIDAYKMFTRKVIGEEKEPILNTTENKKLLKKPIVNSKPSKTDTKDNEDEVKKEEVSEENNFECESSNTSCECGETTSPRKLSRLEIIGIILIFISIVLEILHVINVNKEKE